MSNSGLEFWNKKHFEKEELAKMSQHSVFAEETLKYFPKGGRVLELATGIGSDALFLACQGFEVMATDFSQDALDHIPENTNLKTQQQDLIQPFIRRFKIFVLDDKGSAPRRNHNEDLVRFIGRRA